MPIQRFLMKGTLLDFYLLFSILWTGGTSIAGSFKEAAVNLLRLQRRCDGASDLDGGQSFPQVIQFRFCLKKKDMR